MSEPRPSTFQNALQVSPERIAAMSEEGLNDLMGRLLRAHAYKCGSPRGEVRVNAEGKAKDDGCDGWSAKPAVVDDWLGATDTCWQFKAGSAGGPARLAGEVTKRIPRETLANGGRFVVVASGSTSGAKGEQDRLLTLTAEASTASIPAEWIDVIGSERLTSWCNEHPAVAAYWAGRPSGLWTLDDWLNSDEHQVPWQASPMVDAEIEARRADLDFTTGSVPHLHIQGPPGVGKTRFVLELCRGAPWRDTVIYIRQAADIRLIELIDAVVAEADVRLTLVADEVQSEQLRPLRDSVGRGNGRIRLITIGHSPTPDPTRIPALQVKALDDQVMRAVINGWHQAMPPEHVDFVVRFADGFVRLAWLTANAVAGTPTLDVRGLLSRDEIRQFLDRMLGSGDRRALYVVAVLNSVGWTDDMQVEGRRIAEHFGLEWSWVLATVEDFHRRFGIAPRGGRYRYISPTPLGVHLAVEAWNIFPDRLKSLPDVLPSEEAREAYYERLKSMASNLQAREFAREELAFFFRLDDFVDARAVRRWSALSAANPEEAARNILRALSETSVEDRKRIEDRARRETVWTLVRLAWRSSSFHDAVKALALLAEAENETWANNATAEFVAKFQIFLGGTSVPYLKRLAILDELLDDERPSLARLVVKALAQVGTHQYSRAASNPPSDELPEREWQPRTRRENFECVEVAITRLCDIANRGIPDIVADLIAAANDLSMMLRNSSTRELVASYFDALRQAYPDARESLRRIIADLIYSERKYWHELSEEELGKLEALHVRFEDMSLAARLQQHVGHAAWDREELPELKPIAEELLAAPEILAEHWPWLTSGEVSDAWRLGETLAAVDAKGELAERLPLLQCGGHDMRLLCGYVSTRRQTFGDQWYEKWVTSQFARDPKPISLLFEVAWRCGATKSVTDKIVEILRTHHVSATIVGQLIYGRWEESLPIDVLEEVLRALADAGHRDTAVVILARRMETKSKEIQRWKQLALELVTAPELVRSARTASHHWKEVAKAIVAAFPKEIAAAVFQEQANRESATWFIEHSNAASVLFNCVDHDPKGVWQTLQPYLASRKNAHRFTIGFPKGLLERMPTEDILAWIAKQPEERASIVAKVASEDMSSDDTLISRIIGKYGENERVASAFLSEYLSGMWSGSASSHWDELARTLEDVAGRTSLPKLRRWASDSAATLRKMAERDRQLEEEEELRRE